MSGLTGEQLEYRRHYVCGSDAADVMAGKWSDLWKIKKGRAPEPDLYDKLSPTLDFHVLRHFSRERLELTRLLGHATEPLNRFWYEQQTGRSVYRASEWVVSETYPFMGAHLDGVSTTVRGERCYWDAKWTGRADEAFMLRHTPQGVHNATILGYDWWGLSVFIGNGKWEWIEQEIDPMYRAKLIAAEREFWGHIERDEEPEDRAEPTLPPKPQPKLRTVSLDGGEYDPGTGMWTPPGGAVPENWASEFVGLIYDFAGTHAAYAKHNIVREEMKRLVPEDVGTVLRGRFRLQRDKAGSVRLSLKKEDGEC